jgi:hypothetical protein
MESSIMLFASSLRWLQWHSQRTPHQRARHGTFGYRNPVRQFSVERLEDRMLPSTVTWINPAGGDWDTPSNWDAGRVPIATDDAVINYANISVTHSSSVSDTANSLTSQAAIALSAGSLSLTNASVINNALNISGGTLTSSGDLAVSGLIAWTGGTLSGGGSLTAQGGIQISGQETLDTLSLTNTGSATCTGGTVTMQNGAVFNNNSSLTAQVASGFQANWVEGTGAVPTVNNAGSLIMSGSGIAQFALPFNNSGSVSLQSGVLTLGGGSGTSTSSGSFTGAGGATLYLEGAQQLTNSSSINADNVVFAGASVADAGSYSATSGTSTQVATVSFTGSVASVGALSLAYNDIATFSPASGPAATLTLASLDLEGAPSSGMPTLTGTDSFVVSGLFTWNRGTVSGSGSLIANGGITLEGNLDILDTRTLTNTATAAWTSGNVTLQNGAVFNNNGTLNAQGVAGNWEAGTGPMPTFSNAGIVQKSGGSGVINVGVAFTNTGTVQVQSGTLYLAGPFSNFAGSTLTGGTYLIGATLQFNGANIVTNAASIVLDGPGARFIDQTSANALANLAKNAAGASFTLQAGVALATTGPFTNAGSLALFGSTFTVAAAYSQTAGTTTLTGGTLSAGGQVTIMNGSSLSGSGTVNANVSNAGQVNPGGSGAAGSITINGDYTQTSGGVLNIELGGSGAGQFDQLLISGQAILGGTLNVSALNGYVPPKNTVFEILTFAKKKGDFQTYAGLSVVSQYGTSFLDIKIK